MTARAFEFECPSCLFGVVLGDEDCWVDEHGGFGLAIHPGREPIGSPGGRYDYFHCTAVLCLDCGAEFHAVNVEAIERVYGPGFTVQRVNPAPPTWKEWLAVAAEFHHIQDPFQPKGHISCVGTRCPRCGGRLFTKDELLLRANGRERMESRGYPPIAGSDDVAICPRCKASPLEYRAYFMY
ncbi:MAG: hypothetical protein JW839_10860 [Candidatus Lokiarchaeota archaeon]|nr:hypothetical protein [Candidatus Lokiarchaeota archaeon]